MSFSPDGCLISRHLGLDMLRLLLFTLLPSLAVSSKISAYKQVAAVQNPVYSCDDQATNNA